MFNHYNVFYSFLCGESQNQTQNTGMGSLRVRKSVGARNVGWTFAFSGMMSVAAVGLIKLLMGNGPLFRGESFWDLVSQVEFESTGFECAQGTP